MRLLVLAMLLAAVRAQPKGHRHFHRRAQASSGPPAVTVVDGSVSTPHVEPEVLVYVDEDGQPFSTATQLVLLVPATPTFNEHAEPPTPLAPEPPVRETGPPAVNSVAAQASELVQPVPAVATPEPPPPSVQSSVAAPVPPQDAGPDPTPAPHRDEPAPSPQQDSPAPPPQQDSPAPPPHQDEPAPPPHQDEPAPPPQQDSPAPPPKQADPVPAKGLTGVTYSPYHGDGTCKSAGEVLSDFQQLQGSYSLVRLYGVDCNQVASALPAASAIGVKLFLGLFNLNSLKADTDTMTSSVQAHGGWAIIDTVSVGNELVNNGQATPDQMVAALTSTRATLRGAGYQGPVVTVDTFPAVQAHPVLCDSSDYCAMNVHPFFDPNTSAESAGRFVSAQVAKTATMLANPNQRIVVTESGWPWQGSTNGQAIPSRENQQIAVAAIKSDYGASHVGNLILFTAFNDFWKKADAQTFNAEQYWGMHS